MRIVPAGKLPVTVAEVSALLRKLEATVVCTLPLAAVTVGVVVVAAAFGAGVTAAGVALAVVVALGVAVAAGVVV